MSRGPAVSCTHIGISRGIGKYRLAGVDHSSRWQADETNHGDNHEFEAMRGFDLPSFPVRGGCVCGAIRYGVHSAPLAVYACHCKDCQRFSGGPFSVAMAVRVTDVSLDQGLPTRLGKPADSGRVVGVQFCCDCGTRLWHEPAHSPHLVNIAAGTLDDSSWAKPAAHVWVSRKASWVEISAPCFFASEEQPDARESLYDAWRKATGGFDGA
jgi:hypothetical protein